MSTSRRAASFSWRWAGLLAVGQEEALVEDPVDLRWGRALPVALRVLRDGAHDVVDRLAVAELGGQERLEAEQVAQPERQAAVEEGGQLAEGERERFVGFLVA